MRTSTNEALGAGQEEIKEQSEEPAADEPSPDKRAPIPTQVLAHQSPSKVSQTTPKKAGRSIPKPKEEQKSSQKRKKGSPNKVYMTVTSSDDKRSAVKSRGSSDRYQKQGSQTTSVKKSRMTSGSAAKSKTGQSSAHRDDPDLAQKVRINT